MGNFEKTSIVANMTARLIEIILPDSQYNKLSQILSHQSSRFWRQTVPGQMEKTSCIVQQRRVDALLDELMTAFADVEGFNAYVSIPEAIIPPVSEIPGSEVAFPAPTRAPTAIERFFVRDRISTEEIYDDIQESLHIRPAFLLNVILSSIIAGLGMRSNQVAAIIGAMIIAPLLGPSIGTALAATIGDMKLGRKALLTLIVGSIFGIASGLIIGLTATIDPMASELHNRTIVHPADITLALASGMAGVLAFSRGSALTLVGVMIAVALIPPLAATGIYAGIGEYGLAARALFLFATNLVCINIAGIATFLIQGLPPKEWRITGGILFVWIVILFLLAALITGRSVWELGMLM
ncbi:TIGR00341 family protein [Sphingorhabdus arenilitoris]|uniref:TIGR00341 family protein n=1 Tax=Sphingorhabdus arenilitoris TaxID=1490041 RepID=A0ABV8RE09_9SPHN